MVVLQLEPSKRHSLLNPATRNMFPPEASSQEKKDPITAAAYPAVKKLSPSELGAICNSVASQHISGRFVSSSCRSSTSPTIQDRKALLSGNCVPSSSTTRKLTQDAAGSNATTTGKPPNIVVFSESPDTARTIKTMLLSLLRKDRYTVYSLTTAQLTQSSWLSQTGVVVVCGAVPSELTPVLLNFVLKKGGLLLCLCSDLLAEFLPIFHSAEARPDQLVAVSYGSWKHTHLVQDIFCYQQTSSDRSNSVSVPSSVEVLDADSKMHTLSVDVLAVEETWLTPSLLLATDTSSGGRVVFSQVHLEADPSQYEGDDDKAKALKASDPSRVEIFSDLLSTHLGLECHRGNTDVKYSPAYLLGSPRAKFEFLSKIKKDLEGGQILRQPDLTLKFCGKGVPDTEASATFLPVLTHSYPDSFSADSYFHHLDTKELGQLVIYAPVMTTSMAALSGIPLEHGLVVIPDRQTSGIGRGGTMWLSPEGCAMFSIQLHISLKSELGRLLPFLQHTMALAVIMAIRSQPGLQDLDLGLKWPNDLYGNKVKIGGLICTTLLTNGWAICNLGVGFNLDNKYPTLCVNDMIRQLNEATGQDLPLLTREKYFAIVLAELENLLLMLDLGRQSRVIEYYYEYWLHGGAEVDVTGPDGSTQHVTIVGIDESGFLRVQAADGSEFTVHPDGNTFDMLAGLIAPKVQP